MKRTLLSALALILFTTISFSQSVTTVGLIGEGTPSQMDQ